MTGRTVGTRLPHAVLTVAAVGIAACAGILGIEDRSQDPESLDGSTGGNQLDGNGSSPDGRSQTGVDGTMPTDDGGATASDAPGTQPGEDAPGTQPGVDAGADAPTGATPPACPTPCLLASNLNHPFLMASDATRVYWTEFGDELGAGNGFVKGCALAGCPGGPTIYAAGLTNPRGIAVDGLNVYFATASYGGVQGAIWSCPLTGCGGSPTELAAADIPYGVAVDATYVYWVDYDDSTVHKVAKSGAADAGGDILLYDAASGISIENGQCVVDGPFLYFTDANGDALREPVGGGEPLYYGYGGYGGEFGITTDPTYVYFGGEGEILRSPKTLADGAAPFSKTVADPTGLAFDPASSHIYWSNWGSGGINDGTVGKISIDGGGRQVLASSLASPEAVTVSGNDALWISNGTYDDGGDTLSNTGTLWRVTK